MFRMWAVAAGWQQVAVGALPPSAAGGPPVPGAREIREWEGGGMFDTILIANRADRLPGHADARAWG